MAILRKWGRTFYLTSTRRLKIPKSSQKPMTFPPLPLSCSPPSSPLPLFPSAPLPLFPFAPLPLFPLFPSLPLPLSPSPLFETGKGVSFLRNFGVASFGECNRVIKYYQLS